MKKTKKIVVTILSLICYLGTFGQTSLHVDFKYAPDWFATSICLPDDTFKTLVGPQGQMLYDYGGKKFFPYVSGIGFKTTFHVLADEQIKFQDQKLYSSQVPIVETYGVFAGLTVKQESFCYSSDGLKNFGKKENWHSINKIAREDIIITTITNKSGNVRTISPVIVINSEYPVKVKDNVISIGEGKHLFLSCSIIRVRQNLGEEKTLLELAPLKLDPNETQTIATIFDNGQPSRLAQELNLQSELGLKHSIEARDSIINYWENKSPVPFGHISIPDPEIQDLINSSLRNIWQAREILDGKISFQVGPTCYRGLWIVDGSFLLETATMLDRGGDAREGIEYILSFQLPNGQFGKLSPNFWKENGLVLWACVRHAMLTQDKEWLKSVWPKLKKTVGFIKEMRTMTLNNEITLDDGLIPPGEIDGGLNGAKDKGEYTNIYWNLAGLKAMVQAAGWIGEHKDAENWEKEYEDFYSVFQKAAHRDMATDSFGNKYLPIPMDPKYRSLPQRAQWAFCHGVYPGQLFKQDDPIAKGTMDMLHTTLQEGMVMGTGWIIDGIWNYFASFYGHACLWMGDGQKATQSLYAFANHASPLLTWREEQNPRDLQRSFVGDMPHNWASAEFVRLSVHLLALDRGNELHLFEGLPNEWVKPGMTTSLNQIATPFGKLTFTLKVNESGDAAQLEIDKLSDPSCKKIVVHLANWAGPVAKNVIELDPLKAHSLKINLSAL